MANMRICLVPSAQKIFKNGLNGEGGVVEVGGVLTTTNIPAIKTYLLGKCNMMLDTGNIRCHTFDFQDAANGDFSELHITCTEEEIGGDWNLMGDKRFPLRKNDPDLNDEGNANPFKLDASIASHLEDIFNNM